MALYINAKNLYNNKKCQPKIQILAAQSNAFTSFLRYNSDSSLQPNKINIKPDLKLVEFHSIEILN